MLKKKHLFASKFKIINLQKYNFKYFLFKNVKLFMEHGYPVSNHQGFQPNK